MDNTFIDKLPNKKQQQFWHRAIKVNPKKGLTTAQARRSNVLFGPNRLNVKSSKSLLAQILEHFKELIVILLCIAAVLSFILGIITVIKDPTHIVEYVSLFIETLIIAGIVFVNIFLSIRQADKTDEALKTLKNLVVPMAKVIRNGKIRLIPSVNVVPGDIMVLEAGESIVADAQLLESAELKIDEAILTGESFEVEKDHTFNSTDDMPIGDRKDWVFSGTSINNGSGLCRVIYTGMNTQVGQIAKLLDDQVPELTPLQKQIARLSKVVGIIAVSVCLVTFILYMVAMTGYSGINIQGWGDALNVSISLAIASIPETLLAVVSIILSISVQRMSKQNALIKRLPAIETLGKTSIVCSDKTGTLTKNVMTVVKTWSPKHPLQLIDARKANDPNLDIYRYGSICSDAKIYKEKSRIKYIGDPTETAILKGLVKQGLDFDKLIEKFPKILEFPFDSDRKMMTVVVQSDDPKFKYMSITKGAPDKIFKHLERSKENNLTKANATNTEMGNDALRVLAVGVKYFNQLPKDPTAGKFETKLRLVGLLGIIDPPKPEAKIAVAELRDAGIRTIMITGDHKTTAAAIAKELDILKPGQEVISGAELDLMSEKELIKNVSKYSVYARVSPNDKLRIVNAWKANGEIVAMTGDGVNDAPSLKAANVGCAMGITGTDVAKDASSMILMDDNFATIARAIDMGRKVMLNIKSSLSMLLTANLANFLVIFIGMLVFFLSPLKSLQILFINVAVETLLSFAIARNVRKEDVMSFSPQKTDQFIIDKRMFFEILVFGGLISAMTLAMFYFGIAANPDINYDMSKFTFFARSYNLGLYGEMQNGLQTLAGPVGTWMYKSTFESIYSYGSLLAFLTETMCLSINGLYAREHGSIFKQKIRDSYLMLISIIIAMVASIFVAFTPFVNQVFNMNVYGADALKYVNYSIYLYFAFGSAIILIIISEIYRSIYGIFFNVDGSRRIKGQELQAKTKRKRLELLPDKKPVAKGKKPQVKKIGTTSKITTNKTTVKKSVATKKA